MKTTTLTRLTATAACLAMCASMPAFTQNYYEQQPSEYEYENADNDQRYDAYGNEADWYPGEYEGSRQQDIYQDNPWGGPVNPPGSQVVQLVDRNTPRGPMVAFEHAVPEGWRANGEVRWIQRERFVGCGYADNHFKWSAQSRDGRFELGYLPSVIYSGAQGQYVTGNPYQNCDNVIVRNPKRFLTHHLNRVRPGARVTSYKGPTQQEYQQLRTALPPTQRIAPDTTGQFDVLAGRFVVSYTENGVAYDELVIVSAIVYNLRVTGMMASNMQITAIMPTYYMRAPAGQLNEPLAEAYANSKRDNPGYLQLLKAVSDAKSRRNAQRMISESKARMAANRSRGVTSSGSANEVGDIIAAGYKKRTASNYASQQRMADAAGGVVRYSDPSSNTGYYEAGVAMGQRVWRQDDGSTVVTQDQFYNQGVELQLAQ
ncbi:MAG: hypothetical protein AAF004_07330 [Pseudomonadota bacterium]